MTVIIGAVSICIGMICIILAIGAASVADSQPDDNIGISYSKRALILMIFGYILAFGGMTFAAARGGVL